MADLASNDGLAGEASARPTGHGGGWAPLRFPDFRRLWTAQFTSNVGSWMQTVAAQWAMTSLTTSAVLLTAIQSAGSIPVLLLALPAGVLGDLADRRRLILAAQLLMLLAAAGLAVLAAVGALTPWVLIALLAVIGAGNALGSPTWQTLQPELVPSETRTQAIALGAVNQNLARAVGPAIGGLLLAATSVALVFGVNAVSFVAVLGAVFVTRIAPRRQTLPREHATAALRAGGRFVANSPALLALIARTILFAFFAGATWALLPLVARHRLGLGSGGYGLLLGCIGIGALLAASFGPALRRHLSPRASYALTCVCVGGSSAVLALTHSVAVAAVVLVVSGGGWITALGVLGTGYQSQLPAWAKARSYAYYLIAFQGGTGVGSLALGAVAQTTTLRTSLFVIAGGLFACVIVTWLLPLPGGGDPAAHLSEPLPAAEDVVPPTQGPVAVTVDYLVKPEASDSFLALTSELRRVRRRTGAIHWHLQRDAVDPDRYTEMFVVGSWEEHERQHTRTERADQELLNEIDELLREPKVVRHAFGVSPRKHQSSGESNAGGGT